MKTKEQQRIKELERDKTEGLESMNSWISKCAELEAALAAERTAREKAEAALCSLTPGGSEYVHNPEACVQYVRDVHQSQHNAIVRFKKERDKSEQRWKWVRPILSGEDDRDANSRTLLIAAGFIAGKNIEEIVDTELERSK